jgi:L-rhamnose-H+ transport protein
VSPVQWLGLWLVLAGGFCQGTFMLPMKWTRNWNFENTWLIFASSAYGLFPWIIVFITVPHFTKVFAATSARTLVEVALFGAGWAASAVSFGVGIDAIGLSLGFAIIYGLAAFGGAIIPLLTTAGVSSSRIALTTTSLIVMVIGVAVCSFAGRWKEKSPEAGKKAKLSYKGGVVICVISGLLGACGNLGFGAGGKIARVAEGLGISSFNATSIVWAYLCIFMFLANGGYSVSLLRRNHTASTFKNDAAKYFPFGLLMGALWIAGFLLYGIGAHNLGQLGLSLGWGILMCTVVLIANAWGIGTGEWAGSPGWARRRLAYGLAILIVAIIGLSYANQIH